MEIMRSVQKWGNSGGVLVPKEWLNREVKIILIDRSSDIKKEIFDILDDYLEDIIGVYLTGSYSRGEQREDSDIDIIAISNNTRKEITSGRYNVSIIPLYTIEKTLKNNPLMILPRLIEAKPITNLGLLDKFKEIKISKELFKDFIKDTERIIKINEELIDLEDSSKKYLESNELIYSLLLRLRGIYLIKCILYRKKYSNLHFLNFLKKSVGKDYLNVYEVYRLIKEGKETNIKLSLKVAEKLIKLLKKEVRNG
jgi:predicted nucleotidyltransferase